MIFRQSSVTFGYRQACLLRSPRNTTVRLAVEALSRRLRTTLCTISSVLENDRAALCSRLMRVVS